MLNIGRGRITRTLGLPGTGLSYRTTVPLRRSPAPIDAAAAADPDVVRRAAHARRSLAGLILGLLALLKITIGLSQTEGSHALVVSMRSVTGGVEIVNDTGVAWSGCTVTIDGLRDTLTTLGKGVSRVSFRDYSAAAVERRLVAPKQSAIDCLNPSRQSGRVYWLSR